MKKSLNLYKHNEESYKKVKEGFKKNKIVGIVQATGTGKSYQALQLVLDNPKKKVIYLVPKKSIIEHLQEVIIEEGLDYETYFPNLEFQTYSNLVNMSEQEIKDLEVDLLITDEFHHLGAPVWGARVNKIKETHKKLQIFGMTAYTVRDRGTVYERDMANEEGEELFSNKIVHVYDIVDAMIDAVLPKPRYTSAYIELLELAEFLEKKLEIAKLSKKDYNLLNGLIRDAKKRIHENDSSKELILKNIRPEGKYIYFCPVKSEGKVNDIDTIMKDLYKIIKEKYPNERIIFYKTTSKEEKEGKKNRQAFYKDQDLKGEKVEDCIRIMFAINQYNEGVHAPNVDNVFLGRGTKSDIVFFEQIGRAASVRGKNKVKYEKYNKLEIEELREIAKEQNIEEVEKKTKEEIIEELLCPGIIDLAGNIEFMRELETQLKNRVREKREKGSRTNQKINISNPKFNIKIENLEVFEILKYVRDRLMPCTWEVMYGLACAYYQKYGHLNIPRTVKTLDGITEDVQGYSLGSWISNQRTAYQNRSIPKEQRKNEIVPLSDERVEKLESIGMIWDKREYEWNKMYELSCAYYQKYGHLNVPQSFKTLDGITENREGYSLGYWISTQRLAYQNRNIPKDQRKNMTISLTDRKVEKLESIKMIWDVREYEWNKMYELASAYYKKYGHLNVPRSFKTLDGIIENKEGYSLGVWISTQRLAYQNRKLPKEQIKNTVTSLTDIQVEKLESIGMIWDVRKDTSSKKAICKQYNLEDKYLNTNIPCKELEGKINYLLANNYSLVDASNKPHEIFFMSEANMILAYGITRQEILQYANKKGRKK